VLASVTLKLDHPSAALWKIKRVSVEGGREGRVCILLPSRAFQELPPPEASLGTAAPAALWFALQQLRDRQVVAGSHSSSDWYTAASLAMNSKCWSTLVTGCDLTTQKWTSTVGLFLQSLNNFLSVC